MPIVVTAFYASLFALFALYLSARAGWFRPKAGVSILFGEPVNWDLAERVRCHQNFLEYVPMIIFLMAFLEVGGASTTFLHAIGVLLLVARVFHMIGLKHDNIAHPARAIGAGGTALITLVSAVYLIWLSAPGVF